ncbi:MAG: TIGR00341 family protein [Patescibacteria group bacterium]
MSINNLFKVSQNDRYKFCTHIVETSSPRTDYYFLVILSTLIVALGLMADNVILVIGGMLVTPLLSPVLAIALGVVISDHKVIWRSVRIFLMSFAFALLVALIIGLFTSAKVGEVSIIKIMEPNLFTFFVAVVAGVAASYTWAKPDLNETLPGIAITVTLIPPLTAVGLAIADGNWLIFGQVTKVLLLNMFGIVVASLVVFSLMDFYKAKKKIVEEIKEEKEEIEREKNGK